MTNTNLQITIRGLDAQTKAALAKKAANIGLSLNHYVLDSLRQKAGTENNEVRYQRMREFLASHHVSHGDVDTALEAVAWSDKVSKAKQKADE